MESQVKFLSPNNISGASQQVSMKEPGYVLQNVDNKKAKQHQNGHIQLVFN